MQMSGLPKARTAADGDGWARQSYLQVYFTFIHSYLAIASQYPSVGLLQVHYVRFIIPVYFRCLLSRLSCTSNDHICTTLIRLVITARRTVKVLRFKKLIYPYLPT